MGDAGLEDETLSSNSGLEVALLSYVGPRLRRGQGGVRHPRRTKMQKLLTLED
jgi:hypothetical protein